MVTNMFIDRLPVLLWLLAFPALAAGQQAAHHDEHGGQRFHRLQVETGAGRSDGNTSFDWDLDGWYGTDENKLWLAAEGLRNDGDTEHAEFHARYSRSIADYWDAQVGIRYDTRPDATGWLTAGIAGLAPYFFETGLHLHLSEHGDVGLRLRQENDLLLTQTLMLQGSIEANAYLQDIPQSNTGSGLAQIEAGLQLRHEFSRRFAPYAGLVYERKFGQTASFALANGGDRDTIRISLGLRLLY